MSKTILIVDDEPSLRALLRQCLEDLEDEGVRLLEEANGIGAVRTAQAEKPELVLLDVMMPGMNGYEVTEVIRSDKALEGTRVVLVTARGDDFDRAHGEMVGADRHVTKPFDPDAIAVLAREMLGL